MRKSCKPTDVKKGDSLRNVEGTFLRLDLECSNTSVSVVPTFATPFGSFLDLFLGHPHRTICL